MTEVTLKTQQSARTNYVYTRKKNYGLISVIQQQYNDNQ